MHSASSRTPTLLYSSCSGGRAGLHIHTCCRRVLAAVPAIGQVPDSVWRTSVKVFSTRFPAAHHTSRCAAPISANRCIANYSFLFREAAYRRLLLCSLSKQRKCISPWLLTESPWSSVGGTSAHGGPQFLSTLSFLLKASAHRAEACHSAAQCHVLEPVEVYTTRPRSRRAAATRSGCAKLRSGIE